MLLVFVAALVSLGCAAASFRRLSFALAPTGLEPRALLAALRGEGAANAYRALASRVSTMSGAEWERALFEALARPASERAALVNEQLTELDWLTQRWARVPRVCASIASSAGFLLAALALREGLAVPDALAEETRSAAVGSALTAAVNVATIGVAGTALCIAAQMKARKAARTRLEAVDKLVERLESLAG